MKHSTNKKHIKNKIWADWHRTNDRFKTTRSKRHSNYHGFKKSRSRKNPSHPDTFMQLFHNFVKIIDFGSHSGAHWILKGPPPSTIFWKKFQNKWEQWCPRNGLEKTLCCYCFLMPKWEAWNGKQKVFALYLLQNMRFLGVVKHREKWCQKRSQQRPTSITLAAPGRIFEILERFRKLWFFEDFWLATK